MSQSSGKSSGSAEPRGYTYKSSGVNSYGNHYCARDYGPDVANPNSYHYSNTDGSYYYSNFDGSKYYNDGKGDYYYITPDGRTYSSDGQGGYIYNPPDSEEK